MEIVELKIIIKMTFVCVQPCILYYAWQVEVMLENFKSLGIHTKHDIVCLFAYNKNESDWENKLSIIKKVQKRYVDVAKFYFYEDERVTPYNYISSIRPNILKQHYKAHPHFSEIPVFYHDCDIVFTKYPDFLSSYDTVKDEWYVSNTISYIGYDYIISKGQDVLSEMCRIVGINEDTVRNKQSQSGGAQYILSGIDWRFWHKVEKDCENLFTQINKLNREKIKQDPKHHELQIWCADMWALIWNAWMRGFNTTIIDELSFCWATDGIDNWNNKYIFHNAGVTDADKKTSFYKSQFRDILPYLFDGKEYSNNKASYKYWEIIKSIGEKSVLYE